MTRKKPDGDEGLREPRGDDRNQDKESKQIKFRRPKERNETEFGYLENAIRKWIAE